MQLHRQAQCHDVAIVKAAPQRVVGAGLQRDRWFDGLSAIRAACDGRLEDCDDPTLVASFKSWTYSPELALLQ